MKNLTLNEIEKLIWAKKDAQERLSFMKNRSAARELWNDLQSEINDLRAIARSKMTIEEDEKGAGKLWDYASEIAKQIAFSRNEEGPIYAEEWGQEIIYNALLYLTNLTK